MKALVGKDWSHLFPTFTPESNRPIGTPWSQCTFRPGEHCGPVPGDLANVNWDQYKEEFKEVERITTSSQHDFAIVVLKNVINRFPLCLPSSPSSDFVGVSGTIQGFGFNKKFPDEVKNYTEAHKMKKRGIITNRKQEVESTESCRQTWSWMELDLSSQANIDKINMSIGPVPLEHKLNL